MKFASFDIFDTTLFRKCGKPERIFLLTAQRLYPTDKAKREAFYIWRRGRLADKEETLENIYSDSYLKGFPEYTPLQLMNAELLTEQDNLIPNPEVADKITNLRERGYQIAFISDMYLSSSFLRDLLTKHKIMQEDDNLFVSCEENARKVRIPGDIRSLIPVISVHSVDGLMARS